MSSDREQRIRKRSREIVADVEALMERRSRYRGVAADSGPVSADWSRAVLEAVAHDIATKQIDDEDRSHCGIVASHATKH